MSRNHLSESVSYDRECDRLGFIELPVVGDVPGVAELRRVAGLGTSTAWRSALCICEGAGQAADGLRRASIRRQSASIACVGERGRLNECPGRRGAIAFHKMGSDFVLRLVVPHLRFSEQPPALKGMKHRALAAQRLHCAVANKVFHSRLQPLCPRSSKTDFKTVSLRFGRVCQQTREL